MNKDYDAFPNDSSYDLNMKIGVCERVLESANQNLKGKLSLDQRIIQKMRDKLFGSKLAVALPEFNVLLHYVSCRVIPCFERTKKLTITRVDGGRYVI